MTIGVLVMAYGGPNSLDEVAPYLLDVRGYRPTGPEVVQEVRERYRQIGGRSPILERTQAQAAALEAALNAAADPASPGAIFKTFIGMRHWQPFIKDTLAQMAEAGIRRAVGATRADIVWQFVSEAMLLGLFAGAAGTGLGILATVYLVAENLRMGEAGPQHVVSPERLLSAA